VSARAHASGPAPLLALLAALLAACLPLDRRSPLRGARHHQAVRATEAAIAAVVPSWGAYEAGWARVELSMPRGAPLAGFGERRGAAHRGVRDPVAVRAFALRAGPREPPLVLFAADLLLPVPSVVAAVRRRLSGRLASPRAFFTASHTHSGPGGFAPGWVWSLAFGPYSDEAHEAVVAAHVEAAERALEALAPARIGWARARVAGLGANRVERDGPVDDGLWALSLERLDGRRAALWSFGVHPVTLRADNLSLSADYPGAAAALLEGEEVEVLGFAAGGVGSVDPASALGDPARFTHALLPSLRGCLARARDGARSAGSLASAQVEVPVPELRYRVGAEVTAFAPAVEHFLGVRSLTFGAVALDSLLLLHLPVEASGELSRALHESARAQGVALSVLPFNGSYLGYVVAPRVFELAPGVGGPLHDYETRTLTFLGPEGAAVILDLGVRLAAGVADRIGEVRRQRAAFD
jgi:neutral ceramidase